MYAPVCWFTSGLTGTALVLCADVGRTRVSHRAQALNLSPLQPEAWVKSAVLSIRPVLHLHSPCDGHRGIGRRVLVHISGEGSYLPE